MNFLIGGIFFVCGVLIIRYRYQIYYFTGEWEWAQKYLGGNGTVAAISLIGALCFFIAIAFPLGAFKGMSSTPNGSDNMGQSQEVSINDNSSKFSR